ARGRRVVRGRPAGARALGLRAAARGARVSRLQGYLLRRFVGCSGVAAVVLVTVAWLGAAAFGPTVLPAPWAPLCLLFLIGAVAAAERAEFLGEHTAIAAGGRSGLAHTWPCTVLVWIVLAGAGA